jgi:alpha-tubulin suppressor-like RCC1 family protein
LLAGGRWHSLAAVNGSLYTWGQGSKYQLGNNSTGNVKTPTQLSNVPSTDKTVVSFGGGVEHSLALREDDSLWGWGSNGSGRLGQNPSDISQCKTPCVVPLTEIP